MTVFAAPCTATDEPLVTTNVAAVTALVDAICTDEPGLTVIVFDTTTTGAVITSATDDDATRLVRFDVVEITTEEVVEMGTTSIAMGGSHVL